MSVVAAWAEIALRSLADHLWQSTLVALAAAGLCLLLGRYRAQVRSAIWTAASVKFVVPVALLTTIGGWLPWPASPVAPAPAPAAVWTLGQPFSISDAPASESRSPAPAGRGTPAPISVPLLVLVLWTIGSAMVAARHASRMAEARVIRRYARPLDVGREADAFTRAAAAQGHPRVALRASALCASPCVIGTFRPVLLWPDGISDRLTDAQLDAIMSHEIAHVRRRDNLAAAAQTIVEIFFWFHPLVWWIGTRLGDERERACDEDVLQSGAAPDVYADGILKVCECSMGMPAVATAGIAGSSLTHRIEAIMTPRTPHSLGRIRQALLVATAASLAAIPVVAGAMNKPPQAATSVISGIVTDQMGGIMAGATVTVRSPAGVTRSSVTDENGHYVVADVPMGRVELRVTHSGFRTHVQALSVLAGTRSPVNVQMRIGAVSEEVTVRSPGVSADDPAEAAAREAELLVRVAQAPDDVSAHLALAALYYRQERFAEGEAAMTRAADLIGQRAASARSDYVVTLPRGGAIKEPRKIRDVKPVYPAIARTARVSGVVILEARIAEDGTVRDVRVLRSVPLLDVAAIGAVRQWLFTPTLLNGVPVEVVITATVNFVE